MCNVYGSIIIIINKRPELAENRVFLDFSFLNFIFFFVFDFQLGKVKMVLSV